MVTVYDSKETNFEHNGLGILSPTLCDTTQELNGMYELELQHPFFDAAGMWQNIINGNIVKVDGQLFRIYHKKKNSIGGITVNARHIFYDLLDNFLEDVRPTDLNGAAALSWILSHTQYPHSFVSTSDVAAVNTAYYIKKNPVQAILGEGGIIACWGGELVRDNFTINLKQAMGTDRGVTIRYGKNLKEIEDDSNWDDVITRIYPTGKDGLTLPEKYIDSPLISNYPNPKIRAVEFSAETEDDLRAQAQAYMNSGVDKPVPNYKVDFQELSKTEEYKNFAVLETVYLGDTVTIKNTRYGFDLKAKMIKYKYDHLAKNYKEIQLGGFKKNIANNLVSTLRQMSDVIVNNKADLQKAIDDATTLLNSALGGYVLKRKGEILIMDTEDPMTATKVWRWNLNGLGYSSAGINGPYALAITMDGKISATFITTGSLSGDIIKVGSITSKNGKLVINLDNEIMTISGTSKWMATDGSGSYIGIDGKYLTQYDGTTKTKYFNMADVGSYSINVTKTFLEMIAGTLSQVVPLPEKYKGLDFKVMPTINKILLQDADSGSNIGNLGWVGYLSAKDIVNGTFTYVYQIFPDGMPDNVTIDLEIGYIIVA